MSAPGPSLEPAPSPKPAEGGLPAPERRRAADLQEARRRFRERWLIGIVSVAIAGFTFGEVRLSSFSDGLPATNNLLFFGLVNLNVILTLLLVFLVFRNVAKLIFDRRNNVMGAKLRTKLVLAFAGFTLIPSVLLFSVATGFVVNSVNSWFDPFVESSLSNALEVARLFYQKAEDDSKDQGERIAAAIEDGDLLSPVNADSLRYVATRKREEYRLTTVEVIGRDGATRVLAATGDDKGPTAVGNLPAVEPDFLKSGLAGNVSARTQTEETSDVIRGIAPIFPKGCRGRVPDASAADGGQGTCDAVAVVVVTTFIPQSVVTQTSSIYKGFAGYQQLKIYASPLTTSYVMILTTITLVVVFAATWLGIHLAKGIAVPLKNLADGAAAVAAGNLDVLIPDPGEDEIGQVVAAFNRMTVDLKTSRENLEQRRRYMEVVLTNIAAGVIALDREGRVRAINDAAARLLVADPADVIGKRYAEILPGTYMAIAKELLREIEDETVPSVSRQVSISIDGEARTVMVNVTPLREKGVGYLGMVVVLDDLTPILRAQRVAAWREVARRIAHEIKNPLTPVQLSAQRLQRRFASQITEGREIFDECTNTIETQVEELKNLVNEFSEFARMPEARPAPADLNAVVTEAVSLYRNAHSGIEIAFTAGETVPVFDLDREQVKRAVINLLDNACAAVQDGGGTGVKVATDYDRALGIVRLTIADDGPGISDDVKNRLFEPYFSTKKGGTGLGLTIVHRIVADHEGFIRVQENKPRGTRFVVELPAKGMRTGTPAAAVPAVKGPDA